MKRINKSKFTLEKFEVAKLTGLHLIIGGDVTDVETDTLTSAKCSGDDACKDDFKTNKPTPAPTK